MTIFQQHTRWLNLAACHNCLLLPAWFDPQPHPKEAAQVALRLLHFTRHATDAAIRPGEIEFSKTLHDGFDEASDKLADAADALGDFL